MVKQTRSSNSTRYSTSLREILSQNDEFGSKVDEATRLAFSMQGPESASGRAIVPFFTDHTTEHLKRVEERLDQMLFGTDKLDALAFIPTAEEAMYLISAAWLHDIGMVWGILPNESLNDPDWENCRDQHEQRSADYIQQEWQDGCTWSEQEKAILSEVCIHHRRKHDLAKIEITEVPGKGEGVIRVRELAALLRLADACDITVDRVPHSLKDLFTAMGMPDEATEHWGPPVLVQDVIFDHTTGVIRPYCLIPADREYGTVRIEFRPIIDYIESELRSELASVLPYLGRFPNLSFQFVEAHTPRVNAIKNVDSKALDLWPHMLGSALSASEAASMLATLVRAEFRKQVGAENSEFSVVRSIIGRAREIHQFNALIRSLCAVIDEFLPHQNYDGIDEGPAAPIKSASEAVRMLTSYLDARTDACRQSAAETRQLINNDDVLFIYGYSVTTTYLIQRLLTPFNGKIIVVKCKHHETGQNRRNDTAKVIAAISSYPYCIKTCDLAAVPFLLRHFTEQRNRDVKVLVGSRAVLQDGQVLTSIGNTFLALAARNTSAEVFVLAEEAKLTSDNSLVELIHQHHEVVDGEFESNSGGLVKDITGPIDVLRVEDYTRLVGVNVQSQLGTLQT